MVAVNVYDAVPAAMPVENGCQFAMPVAPYVRYGDVSLTTADPERLAVICT